MKIVIQTNADFTPKGKRTARTVQTSRGGQQLRWYVGGRIFRHLAPTPANAVLTINWVAETTLLELTPELMAQVEAIA